MVLLLLAARHARLNSTRRTDHGQTVRQKQTLPPSTWLTELLRTHGLSWEKSGRNWTDTKHRRGREIECTVLANVTGGRECAGQLTRWSQQEEYLWQYYSKAPDSFSLKCSHTVVLALPLVVSCPERLHRPSWSATPVSLQDVVVAAGKPKAEICRQLQVSEDVLDAFVAAPFCMQLHGIFMLLMQKQAWSSIMCRVAWMPHGKNISKSEQERHNVFFQSAGIPSAEFVRASRSQPSQVLLQHDMSFGAGAVGSSEQPRLELTGEAASRLMSDLRQWAPAILGQTDLEDRGQVQLSLEEHVTRLSHFLASEQQIRDPTLFGAARHTQIDVDKLISSFFASMHLKNRRMLPETLSLALRTMPAFGGVSVNEALVKIPSGASLQRAQLLVDTAYMYFWQEKLMSLSQGHCQNVIYLWLDSSPQGGTDWLLSIMKILRRKDLHRCKTAADQLELSVRKFEAASASRDSSAMIDIARERHQARKVLDECLMLHCLIPSGIGSGAAKVEDKLSSLCRKLYAESHSVRALKTLLSSVHGFCTDAGTEMFIGDVAGVRINDVLPDWMQDPLEPEQEGFDVDDLDMNHQQAAQALPTAAAAKEFLFPNGIISPGALHVLHSMSAEVDRGFQFYDNWLLSFKPLVRLLHADHLRDRFLGTCVVGRFAWMKPQVRKLAEPALWRWGTVAAVLQRLMKTKAVLQAAWSAENFSRQDESGMDSELDVNAVTAAIRSDKFWLYSSMLLQLHAVAEDIASWFEGCPCHPPVLFHAPEHGARTLDSLDAFEDVLPSEHFPLAVEAAGLPREHVQKCPLAGQRSTELASGEFMQLLEEFGDRRLTEVLAFTNVSADSEDLQEALSDYSRGRAQYTAYLTQKFRCWQELPWKFAALNHVDPSEVRSQAVTVLGLLEKAPKDRALHHRKTWPFLEGSEAPIHQQLTALAAGTSLLSDPGLELLRGFVHEFRFIPTVERIQEADHAIVKKFITHRVCSGPYVSTAIRMAEMMKLFDSVEQYQNLLRQWPKILDPDDVSKRLGVWRHPQYQQAVEDKVGRKAKRILLSVLLYRLDPESQFASSSHVRKKRDQRARRLEKVKDSFFKQLNPEIAGWSSDNVERRAAAQHMQDRMETGRLYSMPQEIMALPSLQDRLASVKQAVLPQVPLESLAGDSLSMNDNEVQTALSVHEAQALVEGRAATVQEARELVPARAAASEVPVMFFRVNCNAPARHKTLPLPAASGMKLAPTDMTVTVHDSRQCEDACWVEVDAKKAQGIASSVSILSLCNADAKQLPSLLQQWSTCQSLSYGLKRFPQSKELSTLLGRLLTHRSFADAPPSQHLVVSRTEASFSLCQRLQDAGFITCAAQTSHDATWKFTLRGLQDLILMHEVGRPTLVFDPLEALLDRAARGLETVQQFSTWELLQVLQHRGFQLRPLPSKRKDRRALPPHTHDDASPIMYCGSKTSVTLETAGTRTYMQALVMAPDLFSGIVRLV
ncbi:unnamed protein product [Symbiodinium sp. CCMP2592]|nr:unnamed protein product [Symbiodinium sp. CCMP2592]